MASTGQRFFSARRASLQPLLAIVHPEVLFTHVDGRIKETDVTLFLLMRSVYKSGVTFALVLISAVIGDLPAELDPFLELLFETPECKHSENTRQLRNDYHVWGS